MGVRDFFVELAYPLRSTATLIALITFFLLLSLAKFAGLLGIWLLVAVLPALFRYLVLIAEARARAIEAAPPGIEYFSMVGNLWTLFPVLPVLGYGLGLRYLLEHGEEWVWLYAAGAALLFPAMMAVLVITYSPLQALNPLGWYRLIRRVGSAYLYGPLLLIVFAWLPAQLPSWAEPLTSLYLLFAFYAVVGRSIQDERLIDDVDIPDPVEAGPELMAEQLARQRTKTLNHAYGLVSRGNRDGGLGHIYAFLADDPDPDAGWRWFFEQMLEWENRDHALFFAQRYLTRLLSRGEAVQAVKLILRGRLLNDRFRPASADLPAAIEAAENAGNGELAEALRRLL